MTKDEYFAELNRRNAIANDSKWTSGQELYDYFAKNPNDDPSGLVKPTTFATVPSVAPTPVNTYPTRPIPADLITPYTKQPISHSVTYTPPNGGSPQTFYSDRNGQFLSSTPNQTPYDYKTDPTFLSWKANYDSMAAQNLEQANKTWQEKYGGLQGQLNTANMDLERYKPFEQKYNQAQQQLMTTQANFDDVSNRFSALQSKQANSINSNNQQSINSGTGTSSTNIRNYNDNRDASADQWWAKYLTGRR